VMAADKLSIAAPRATTQASISDDRPGRIRDVNQAKWQQGPPGPCLPRQGPAGQPPKRQPPLTSRAKAILSVKKAVTPAPAAPFSQRRFTAPASRGCPSNHDTERRPTRPPGPAEPQAAAPIGLQGQLVIALPQRFVERPGKSQLPPRSKPVRRRSALTRPARRSPKNHPSPARPLLLGFLLIQPPRRPASPERPALLQPTAGPRPAPGSLARGGKNAPDTLRPASPRKQRVLDRPPPGHAGLLVGKPKPS